MVEGVNQRIWQVGPASLATTFFIQQEEEEEAKGRLRPRPSSSSTSTAPWQLAKAILLLPALSRPPPRI
ncbi:hypothetical protein GQ55_3G008200 [Panicum hallii var. hallii]|uniref:Uncharacterized protein n=1 Tax=Panicum hallii var. hallii TaxID=1504633 RepID=A0A2T7E4F9_9POAL|nr:hypothetical protein GQ55_3G008200 [Panicum hallii var. hallii]